MRKLLIILLSVLALTTNAQQKKTVAVLDPICRDNSVNAFFQQMVRGSMESAITASSEYEAYDRSAFDQIQKEQAFQRTGVVSDSQIKKMGEMAGVDYVLVSEVSAFEGYLSVIIKILNITTGRYDKSIDDVTELSPNAVKSKCREMASSLFGALPAKSLTSKKQIPEGYIDLGLPSGTLWKVKNEDCGLITYDQAYRSYGSSMPTIEQFEELKDNCLWTWTGTGYNVKGNSGAAIFLPAAGFRGCGNDGNACFVNKAGFYWSSLPEGSEDAWNFSFNFGRVDHLGYTQRCLGLSVRLVK